MKIQLEISKENEATDSPWWILIDPLAIKEMMEGIAEHGELPDSERILTAIAFSIEGPFFSRAEANDYLKQRQYAYSSAATVWCASGYRSKQYREAIRNSNE